MDKGTEVLEIAANQLFGELVDLRARAIVSMYAQARIIASLEGREVNTVLKELKEHYDRIYNEAKNDVLLFVPEWLYTSE